MKILLTILFCLFTVVESTTVTKYGCLFASLSNTESALKMDSAGFKLIRLPIFLSTATSNSSINQMINWGYNVQINLNWKPTSTAVAWVTDTVLLKSRANTFFTYYLPYKNQIPVIAIENEWDNNSYHSGSINDYITELRILTTMAHSYGFKVMDAGVTSTALQRWTYSQLSGTEATTWRQNYFVGQTLPTYLPVLAQVEAYAGLIRNIPIDYLNVHWYNVTQSSNGFQRATGIYAMRCSKKYIPIVTNEFGQKTQSYQVWSQTVNEVSKYSLVDTNKVFQELRVVPYAIAYSGVNDPNLAIRLDMDKLLLMADVVIPPPPPPPVDSLPVDTIVPPPPPPPPLDTTHPNLSKIRRNFKKVQNETP